MSILSQRNVHERDKNIVFFENEHKYVVNGCDKYTSVTTWIHSLFQGFNANVIIDRMMKGKNWNENNKYWGMTSDEIKKLWNENGQYSSKLGTELHYAIEMELNNSMLYPEYNNNDVLIFRKLCDSISLLEMSNKDSIYGEKEWSYFENFMGDHKELIPYRTEWIVYDLEYRISGSIDMVYKNADGSLSIYDWKRTKEISKINNWNKKCKVKDVNIIDSNYWHYSLQLNTYKFILEKNYGKQIKSMHLVRLHPNAENYEIYDVNDMQDIVKLLLDKKLDSEKKLL